MTSAHGPDPRTVQRADVYKAGRLAATLTRAPDHIEFRYRAAYLDGEQPDVATTLPRREDPVVTTGGAVPAYFAGLLPEGRRLTSLRTVVKTSADDEFSLLLAVGADPVGDVQVVPEGADPTIPEGETVLDDSFQDIDFLDLLERSGLDRSALAGVQDKVSGRMITVPLRDRGRGHLLKLNPPEFPHVVENEAYFLGVARRLRHPVAEAEVVHDAAGRSGLLITRFDRVRGPDGEVLSLPVEDATQLLGRYPADKYLLSAEEVATRIGEVCPARAVALRAVFRQIVFAWATGNGDQHAKNLSVVQRPDGEWRVSPVYDIPSTIPYGDHTTALAIHGRRDGISRKRLLAFAESIGLTARAADRAIEEVLDSTADVVEDLRTAAIPFDPRRIRDLTRSLTRRRTMLERH